MAWSWERVGLRSCSSMAAFSAAVRARASSLCCRYSAAGEASARATGGGPRSGGSRRCSGPRPASGVG